MGWLTRIVNRFLGLGVGWGENPLLPMFWEVYWEVTVFQVSLLEGQLSGSHRCSSVSKWVH